MYWFFIPVKLKQSRTELSESRFSGRTIRYYSARNVGAQYITTTTTGTIACLVNCIVTRFIVNEEYAENSLYLFSMILGGYFSAC